MLAFSPYMLERQAPVRCVAVQDGVRRFIRPRSKDRERFVRSAIRRNLRVQGFIPEGVGTEPHDLLPEATIDQHRRVGSHGHAR